MDQEAFFEKIGPAAVRATAGTSIFPSVKMAQAAIETGYGKHVKGNNLFGIKARGDYSPFWKGKTFSSDTKEFRDGQYVTINDEFRAYNSLADSIRDHSWFLIQNKNYARAGVFAAENPYEQAAALKRAGYATDPSYAQKIGWVIDTYDLTRWDTKKRNRKIRNLAIIVVVIVVVFSLLWMGRKSLKNLK